MGCLSKYGGSVAEKQLQHQPKVIASGRNPLAVGIASQHRRRRRKKRAPGKKATILGVLTTVLFIVAGGMIVALVKIRPNFNYVHAMANRDRTQSQRILNDGFYWLALGAALFLLLAIIGGGYWARIACNPTRHLPCANVEVETPPTPPRIFQLTPTESFRNRDTVITGCVNGEMPPATYSPAYWDNENRDKYVSAFAWDTNYHTK